MTNKPEIVAYVDMLRGQERRYVTLRGDVDQNSLNDGDALIRLSDYEALQADFERLRKHLQSLIDQTTPLVPEPGSPMWSRRIQLDEVIAERDSLRAECEKLRKDAERYRWLRDGNNWENSEAMRIAMRHYGTEWDEMIDIALAAHCKGGDV